jgi:hypothetical protein
MRRIFCSLMVACFLAVPLIPVNAGARGNPEIQLLKQQQKAERKAMKLRHHYQKEAMKGQVIVPAVRVQMKHQMQREERELSEKHKDQMQDMKDRMRLYKESMRQWGQ